MSIMAVEMCLASLSLTERRDLAEALAGWLNDERLCRFPTDRNLNRVLSDALERRGINTEEQLAVARREGM